MRTHGCETPCTIYSTGAIFGQVLVLTWFAVVEFGFLVNPDGLVLCSVLWSVFLVLGLGCWLWCQLVDPAELNAMSCYRITKEHDSHYCAVCKKAVPGIDHVSL